MYSYFSHEKGFVIWIYHYIYIYIPKASIASPPNYIKALKTFIGLILSVTYTKHVWRALKIFEGEGVRDMLRWPNLVKYVDLKEVCDQDVEIFASVISSFLYFSNPIEMVELSPINSIGELHLQDIESYKYHE